MTQIEVLASMPNVRGGYKVDVSRGTRIGRVSSEWFNRPPDERFLSLTDLWNSVQKPIRTQPHTDRGECGDPG